MAVFLLAAGVSAIVLKNVMYSAPAPKVEDEPENPEGNTIPFPTRNIYKSFKYYLHSPWDPTRANNLPVDRFYDIYNMPRTDYLLPDGRRVPTWGLDGLGSSTRPPYPTLSMPGTRLTPNPTPIMENQSQKRRKQTVSNSAYHATSTIAF